MTHTNDLLLRKKGIELFWVLNAFRPWFFTLENGLAPRADGLLSFRRI